MNISDGRLDLVFGAPENWPVLRVTQAKQLNLENADFNLEANRKVLFGGNGQISAVGDISFLTGATSPTEQLRIFANGNIGIGTAATVPTNKLEVVGTIKANDLEISGTVKANKFVGEVAGLNDKISKTGGTITGALAIQNNLTVSGSLILKNVTVNNFSSDGNLNGNSDLAIPTEKAVKNYVDNIAVTTKIADNVVTAAKIADSSVITAKIKDGAITQEKLAASISLPIPDGTVGTAKLANSAITTDKIADKSITAAKLNFSISPGGSQWSDGTGGSISYSKGNVGIGTNNPQDKLDVAGNLRILTDSNPIRFTSAWSGFPDSKPNQAEISNDTGSYKTLMIIGNKSAGGVRKVSVWDYLQINGGMDITGNVGIGTSTPQAKLQVVNGAIMPSAGNSETAGIMFPKDAFGGSGDAAWIRHYRRGDNGEATTLEIGTSNDPDDHIALMPSGNVGVGTTTPGFKLDVADRMRVRQGKNGDAGIWFYQTAPASDLAFVGMQGDNQVGFWGNGVGWGFVMDTNNGNVGIGTTNPMKGKVHIEGSVINDVSPFAYYAIADQSTNFNVQTGRNPTAYSLYANQRIAAAEFNAFSDVRIKEIQGPSDSENDLQSLLQIEVTDYYYRDKIVNGDRQQKKVIGQQVATVFPQAVKTHTDVVPDIFKPASIADGWVSLPAHGLQVGERVRFLLEGVEPQIYTIEAVTPDSFQVSLDSEGEVFVYGREVNDFHVVDYDALAMLNISATQELYKIIDALKIEVQQIKAQLNGSHHPIAAFFSP